MAEATSTSTANGDLARYVANVSHQTRRTETSQESATMKMLTGVQGTGDAHPVKRRLTAKKRLSNRHCPAAASSATPSGWWPKNTMGITTAVRPRPTLIGLRKSGSGEKRVAVHEMASSRSGKSVPRRRYCSHVSRSPCWGKRLATSTICKRASPTTQRCWRSANIFRARLTRDRGMGLFLTFGPFWALYQERERQRAGRLPSPLEKRAGV